MLRKGWKSMDILKKLNIFKPVPKEKIYTYTETQNQEIHRLVDDLLNKADQAYRDRKEAYGIIIIMARMLDTVRSDYPYIYSECINPEEVKTILDWVNQKCSI